MIFLGLSILSSSAIYIIFKCLDRFNISTFNVIVINYFIATLLGLIITDMHISNFAVYKHGWFPYSIIIGILFISMFVIIAKSSQIVGLAITTISNKMSVIIPIVVSIIIDPKDVLTNLKVAGIIMAISAVFLSVYKKRKKQFDARNIYLPVILFLGMGLIDSFVKYAQQYHVSDKWLPLFSVTLFAMSAITGVLVKVIKNSSFKELLNPQVLFWGFLLGISNYGSLYFIIKALNYKSNTGNTIDGSVIFGINNLGIIAFSVFVGYLIFKERFLKINWVGIILSFITIYILSKV